MNVSYRWLKDMVSGLELDPDGISEHLALRGAPIEGVSSPGEGLGDVVMGKVLTVQQHPNADRLKLCSVEAGDGPLSVVCGAPVVVEGGWYPFAPVGSRLPGVKKALKKAEIRGEVSNGMLCSVKELGLGTKHEGIYLLEGDFTAGESFVEAMGLDDVTLDVEVTANRGDLMSHVGVARELASEGAGTVNLPEIPGNPHVALNFERDVEEARAGDVGIRIEDPDLCSRYIGVVIRGVRVADSPEWLQQRLRGAGSRPINNVVDATNYVMLELGQPLHAFDLNKLGGTSIVVRRADESESAFTTLDDEKRTLSAEMLMICDSKTPVAIAGVMGGLDSDVSDDTTDILLECALFNPASIRATRKELVMSTDASYRFERGVDPEGLEQAVARATAIILATTGGVVDGPALDCAPGPFAADVVPLRLSRIEHLLGVPFGSEQVQTLLAPLGFDLTDESDGVLNFRVPGWRSYDVKREVDLIEEVARTYGYDKFPSDVGMYRPGTVPDDPMFALQDDLRGMLVARALYEAQTPAFVSEAEGDVQVANPLTTTEPYVRRAILPTLLRRVEHNFAHGNRDVRLFEIGTSFRKAASGEPPDEAIHLAGVLAGRRQQAHWTEKAQAFDIWDLKGLLEAVGARAHGQGARVLVADEAPAPYAAGSTFELLDGAGHACGGGGLIAAEAIDAPVWAGDVWGFEITLPAEPTAPPVPVHEPLPGYPAVERDLALVVGAGTLAEQVDAIIRDRAGELLESVELFDVYRGDELEVDARSLAFRLRFRAGHRTLKDKEVDKVVTAILGRLKEELGVEARG